MRMMNSLLIEGRLTRDPELRYTVKGTPVAKFSVAVEDGSKDNPHVSFFNCEAWGRTAENLTQYKKKGHGVMINGRLKQESFEGKGGEMVRFVKIIAEEVQFRPVYRKPEAEGINLDEVTDAE